MTPIFTQDDNGFFVAPGFTYDLDGKIRDKPISKDTLTNLLSAVRATGPDLEFRITSGGQDPFGRRTGSTRHDVDETGYTNTADLVLTRNGEVLLPPQHRELYADLFRNAASRGFTGLGHYPWGVHIGDGKQAVWGPTTRRDSVDPVMLRAAQEGFANPVSSTAASSSPVSRSVSQSARAPEPLTPSRGKGPEQPPAFSVADMFGPPPSPGGFEGFSTRDGANDMVEAIGAVFEGVNRPVPVSQAEQKPVDGLLPAPELKELEAPSLAQIFQPDAVAPDLFGLKDPDSDINRLRYFGTPTGSRFRPSRLV